MKTILHGELNAWKYCLFNHVSSLSTAYGYYVCCILHWLHVNFADSGIDSMETTCMLHGHLLHAMYVLLSICVYYMCVGAFIDCNIITNVDCWIYYTGKFGVTMHNFKFDN